jgi:hypothetical protein
VILYRERASAHDMGLCAIGRREEQKPSSVRARRIRRTMQNSVADESVKHVHACGERNLQSFTDLAYTSHRLIAAVFDAAWCAPRSPG